MLNKKYYIDDNGFQYEMNQMFKNTWLFVCLVTDLKKNNDFITFDLANISIAIHNFNGEIVAFQNICSHRLKRIHTEKRGNRPFYCMYHGWNYNKDGIPSIPKRKTFEIDNIECLKLKKYNISICGVFVFVNLNTESKVSLKNYLGEFYNDLLNISNFFGPHYKNGSITHSANWKLLVENVLEGYHCPLVHRETLVNSGYCIDYPKDIKYFNQHSSWHSPRLNKDISTSKKLDFLKNLQFKHNSFYHIYIYPNLFISSTSGSFFYIGNLSPDSVDRSILNYTFFSASYDRKLLNSEIKLDEALFNLNSESALNVLYEDKPMVESCQLGLSEESNQNGILSQTEEIRIINFHRNLEKEYINYV